MKKTHRLRDSRLASALFRRGRRVNSPLFSCFCTPNRLGHLRLVIVVSKKSEKKATRRNTARRQIREWVRKDKELLSHSLDLGFIVKKEAFSVSRNELYEELGKFKKILSNYAGN